MPTSYNKLALVQHHQNTAAQPSSCYCTVSCDEPAANPLLWHNDCFFLSRIENACRRTPPPTLPRSTATDPHSAQYNPQSATEAVKAIEKEATRNRILLCAFIFVLSVLGHWLAPEWCFQWFWGGSLCREIFKVTALGSLIHAFFTLNSLPSTPSPYVLQRSSNAVKKLMSLLGITPRVLTLEERRGVGGSDREGVHTSRMTEVELKERLRFAKRTGDAVLAELCTKELELRQLRGVQQESHPVLWK